MLGRLSTVGSILVSFSLAPFVLTQEFPGYDRSVLLIFRDADEAAITLRIKGDAWGLEQLESATHPPSPLTKAVAGALLAKLSESEPSRPSTNSAVALMRYAIACKNDAFWNQVLPYCGSYEETIGTAISEALKVFAPDAIRPGYVSFGYI